MKYLKMFLFLSLILNMGIKGQSEFTKLKLNSITIKKMPFINDYGVSWDKTSGPDVYLMISDYRNIQIENTRYFKYQDLSLHNLPVTINLDNSIIYQANAPFSILIRDADAFSDDTIRIIRLIPTDFPYPEEEEKLTYTYKDESETTEIEISYDWLK